MPRARMASPEMAIPSTVTEAPMRRAPGGSTLERIIGSWRVKIDDDDDQTVVTTAAANAETFELLLKDFRAVKKMRWHDARLEFLRDFDFISRLPTGPVLDYSALGPSLPPAECPTLFLDLDETLSHTEVMPADDPATQKIIKLVQQDPQTSDLFAGSSSDDLFSSELLVDGTGTDVVNGVSSNSRRKESSATTDNEPNPKLKQHTASDGGNGPEKSPLSGPRRLPDLVFASSDTTESVAFVYFRPWAGEFLRVMAQQYQVVCYTASLKSYADTILDALDTEKLISYRLYRDDCTQYGGTDIFFKDLHGTGRELERSVLLDNRIISFGLNPDNGVLLTSYMGAANDTDLLSLVPFLIKLSREPDVRIAIRKLYHLSSSLEKYRSSEWRRELDLLIDHEAAAFEILQEKWKAKELEMENLEKQQAAGPDARVTGPGTTPGGAGPVPDIESSDSRKKTKRKSTKRGNIELLERQRERERERERERNNEFDVDSLDITRSSQDTAPIAAGGGGGGTEPSTLNSPSSERSDNSNRTVPGNNRHSTRTRKSRRHCGCSKEPVRGSTDNGSVSHDKGTNTATTMSGGGGPDKSGPSNVGPGSTVNRSNSSVRVMSHDRTHRTADIVTGRDEAVMEVVDAGPQHGTSPVLPALSRITLQHFSSEGKLNRLNPSLEEIGPSPLPSGPGPIPALPGPLEYRNPPSPERIVAPAPPLEPSHHYQYTQLPPAHISDYSAVPGPPPMGPGPMIQQDLSEDHSLSPQYRYHTRYCSPLRAPAELSPRVEMMRPMVYSPVLAPAILQAPKIARISCGGSVVRSPILAMQQPTTYVQTSSLERPGLPTHASGMSLGNTYTTTTSSSHYHHPMMMQQQGVNFNGATVWSASSFERSRYPSPATIRGTYDYSGTRLVSNNNGASRLSPLGRDDYIATGAVSPLYQIQRPSIINGRSYGEVIDGGGVIRTTSGGGVEYTRYGRPEIGARVRRAHVGYPVGLKTQRPVPNWAVE